MSERPSKVVHLPPGNLQLVGEWLPIWRALERSLNASFHFQRVVHVWKEKDVWDLTIGWLSSSLKLRERSQFTATYRSVCYSICVPHMKVSPNKTKTLVRIGVYLPAGRGPCRYFSCFIKTRVARSFVNNLQILKLGSGI